VVVGDQLESFRNKEGTMAGHKSIRGTCAICKQQGVTNYHYKKIHQLIPKKIFRYLSGTKVWDCSRHNVQSPDPHTMMWHYKQAHMEAAADDTSLPMDRRQPQLSDPPPITAAAIVAAFEARVMGIDEQDGASEGALSYHFKRRRGHSWRCTAITLTCH